MLIPSDDTVADTYFLNAMAQVAQDPQTNLVYSNQQFFGESKWQWHVPELRPDLALVNGPLPLMTLWRKALWHATPHGFDEALPRGHEDWAYRDFASPGTLVDSSTILCEIPPPSDGRSSPAA